MTASRSQSVQTARCEGWARRLPESVESVGYALAVVVGEHDHEGADVPGLGVEFGAVGADGVELESFEIGESFRAFEDPSGGGPGCGRTGGQRLRRGALLLQGPRTRRALGSRAARNPTVPGPCLPVEVLHGAADRARGIDPCPVVPRSAMASATVRTAPKYAPSSSTPWCTWRRRCAGRHQAARGLTLT